MLKWLKKWLPNQKAIQKEKRLRWLREYLHHSYLWHFHRRTVAKGFAIGLFVSFLPMPLQMLWAALLAIALWANLPVAVITTWINNPFTFVFINYFVYKVGAWIAGEKVSKLSLPEWEWHRESFNQFWHEFLNWFGSLGKAYLIGLPIVAICSALLGYFLVMWLWKISVYYRCKKRKRRSKNKFQ